MNSCRRRILAEFKRDWAEGINHDNTAIIDNHYNLFHNLQNSGELPDELNIFLISFAYSKTFLITLQFPNTYPFKCPKIKINTLYDYFELCGTIPTDLVKDTMGLNCLCCNSMLCNWGPSRTIKSLMEECLERLELKLRSSNINIAKLCVIKKFGHYLPISEFL